VDLFPVVDPAIDWVREVDTDLVGCVFRVVIPGGGGGLGKGRGEGGGCRGRRRGKKDIGGRGL